MKSRMILAASIAFALTNPAFAQDNSQSAPPPPPENQTVPADSPAMSSDDQQPAPTTKHHRARHHRATGSHLAAHMDAHLALTGDEPRIVAYQGSPHFKSYPAVDPGHVPGDPPVIDHSADHATVPPSATKIIVPPGH